MLDACAKFVNSCPTCQEARETKVRGKTGILKMPNESVVNFRVHIDLFGPLKSSTAMKWILVATCAFSRYTRICAIKDKCEKTVATAFFNTWVCLMGCPALLVSDNGGEFINKVFKEVLALLGTSKSTTTPFHPASNGSAEVYNKSVIRYLRSFVDTGTLDWTVYLPSLEFCMNTSRSAATRLSPYEVIFGRKARYPYHDGEECRRMLINGRSLSEGEGAQLAERIRLCQRLAEKNAMSFKDCYLEKYSRDCNDPQFQPGEQCYLHAPLMALRRSGLKTSNRKFVKPWLPAVITKVFNNNTVAVRLIAETTRGAKDMVVHKDRLKLRIERPGSTDRAPLRERQEPSKTHTNTTPESSDSSSEEEEEEEATIEEPIDTPVENGASEGEVNTPLAPEVQETIRDSVLPLVETPRNSTSEPLVTGPTSSLDKAVQWAQGAGRALRSQGKLTEIPESAKANVGRKPRSDRGRKKAGK